MFFTYKNMQIQFADLPMFVTICQKPKPSKKKGRQIDLPNQTVIDVQNLLLDNFRKEVNKSSFLKAKLQYSHGGVVSRSVKTIIKPHLNHQYFFIVDLKDAYHSVNLSTLAGLLVRHMPKLFGKDEGEVYDFLKNYCSSPETGGLAVGAPASPDLFNFYRAMTIDGFIESMLNTKKNGGLYYSNFLDDLVFSSKEPIGSKRRPQLLKLIRHFGLRPNNKKIKVVDTAKKPVIVCGVGIEWKDNCSRLFLPRTFINKLRGLLLVSRNEGEKVRFQVEGMMGVFKMVVKQSKKRTRTEQKILVLYSKFRQQLKTGK